MTVAQARDAKWHMAMHLNMDVARISTYRCDEVPQLSFVDTVPTGRGRKTGQKPSRMFYVAGVDGSFPTLTAAVAALNESAP